MRIAIGLAVAALLTAPAAAQPRPTDRAAAVRAAWRAGEAAATRGPADVALLEQGSLHIGADQAFIPADAANRIMAALGNSRTPGRYGLVVSQRADASWIVDVEWIKEGYVRDGDAKDWKSDELFRSIKQGTDEANVQREAQGLPALDLTGWVEPPAYDAATHRLVWSLAARERGAPAGTPQTVNYNTYALGRQGYWSLDLITDMAHVGADKAVAQDLLGSLRFTPGKRYQDFNGSTDKVAAYGLAALVGVVAVKKLGLLALGAAFLVKIWKLALLAVAGVGSAVRRFWRGRDRGDVARG